MAGPEIQGNISATFSLCTEFKIIAVLHSSFNGSLFDFWAGARSKVHWNKHTTSTEFNGLGNQAFDLPEKFLRSRVVKKYLNDVTKLVWHTGRTRSSGKKLQLYRENGDKGKGKDVFRKDAWTKWARKKLEESITDLYRDIEMTVPRWESSIQTEWRKQEEIIWQGSNEKWHG